MEIPKEVGISWVGSKLRGAFSMTEIAGHVRTKEERERERESRRGEETRHRPVLQETTAFIAGRVPVRGF
jgi:hypothetical protein